MWYDDIFFSGIFQHKAVLKVTESGYYQKKEIKKYN